MTLRLTVEWVCDARRARGCHGASAAQGDALATVVFAVEAEAQSVGWGKVRRAGGNIITDDVCPACRALAPRSPGR